MKYSNYAGVLTAILLIICCFLPWVYVESINTAISGLKAERTNYGKPGILHLAFSVLSIIFFLIPAIWAKRANLFVASFNVAWAIRNFLLMTHCELGECPHRYFTIYAIPLLSILMLIMAMIPKVELKN